MKVWIIPFTTEEQLQEELGPSQQDLWDCPGQPGKQLAENIVELGGVRDPRSKSLWSGVQF